MKSGYLNMFLGRYSNKHVAQQEIFGQTVNAAGKSNNPFSLFVFVYQF